MIKEFPYRGATEEWSNQYHTLRAAADPAGWRDLVDGLIAAEKTVYTSVTTVVRALCYDDTDDAAVYSYDLADFAGVVPGTLAPGSALHLPGDTASWVRWNTGDVSSTGKPVYLRKYFHDVLSTGSPNFDVIYVNQRTALQDFGDLLLDVLTGDFELCSPSGTAPVGPAKNSTYATTRTLHRRGRRP